MHQLRGRDRALSSAVSVRCIFATGAAATTPMMYLRARRWISYGEIMRMSF
jgi:hypothetical protein